MSNILGPYSRMDWNTLRLLSRSIKQMKKKDPIKLREAINKEKELFKEFLAPTSEIVFGKKRTRK